MGSLRWWYEAIIRGIYGEDAACDPQTHICLFDRKQASAVKPYGVCRACRVFGATGWARRFHLLVEDNTTQEWLENENRQRLTRIELLQRQYTVTRAGGSKTATPKWFFPDSFFGRCGSLGLTVISTGCDIDGKPFDAHVVAGLIQFIAYHSSLGGRPQLGFGVVRVITPTHIDVKPLLAHLPAQINSGASQAAKLPALSNMFFAKVRPKASADFAREDAFVLKYDLRRLFPDAKTRHEVMGEAPVGETIKVRAKVMVSLPYPTVSTVPSGHADTMRLWGWLPDRIAASGGSIARSVVLQQIYDHLSQHYDIAEWRELNPPSSRPDTIAHTTGPRDFLASLLNVPGAL